jgi:hypothetical protein
MRIQEETCIKCSDIFPEVNPIIRDLLNKQRKPLIKVESEKQYRCNACCKYFTESETNLYKYNPDSLRRHRVCLKCIKIMQYK